MTAPRPRSRQPKKLDAGTFQAEIASFGLHLAAGGKAARTALFQDIEDRCLKTSRTGGQVLNPAWAAACLTS